MRRPSAGLGRSLLCLALVALAGCGAGQSAPELLASARGYLAQHDTRAAVIQLRNALQKEPRLVEARLLLAQALLDDGRVAPAAVEVRKAMEFGGPQEQLVPLAARVLLAEGRAQLLLERFGSTALAQPAAQATLQTQLALAHLWLDDRPRGEAALRAALATEPALVEARLLQARVLAADKDLAGARRVLDEVLQQHPDSHDAWIARGDLLHDEGDGGAEAAPQAYRKALALRKDSIPGYVGLIATLLGRRQFEEAAAEIARFKSAHPDHPRARTLETTLALHKGDIKQARELAQALLKAAPQDVQLLQLAAAVESQGGSPMQAMAHLSKAVHLAPNLPGMRQWLAQAQLQAGEPARALETLQPLLPEPSDTRSLTLAAQAHEQQAQLEQAEQYYRRAAQHDPADLRTRTALALTRFARGQTGPAVDELQSLAASNRGITADLALINAQMRRKHFDEALRAIDALQAKTPGKPVAFMLRGRVHLALRQPQQARQSFEQAWQADPLYLPAALNLAALDLRQRHYEAARKRFDKLLQADPRNMQALLTVAGVRAAEGAPAREVGELYATAVRLNPTEGVARVALVEHHLSQKNTQAALGAAREAVAALADNAGLLAVLARVQALSGDLDHAMGTLTRLTQLQPASPQALLLLAEAQAAAKRTDEAVATLTRAQALAPNSLQVHQRLVATLLAAGRAAQAQSAARALQAEPATQVMGYVLEGDLLAAQRQWREAAAAFRQALQQRPSSTGAVSLHSTLLAYDKAEAAAFAAKWMGGHADDAGFARYLGDTAMAQRDFAQAETWYGKVLRLSPDDAAVLNNLVWVLTQLGRPGAVEQGERLNRLQPDVPAFMDTLALALGGARQWDRAIELQKRAISLDAQQSPALRLTLARLYLDAGLRTQARGELDALGKLGPDFKQHAEVARLQRQL